MICIGDGGLNGDSYSERLDHVAAGGQGPGGPGFPERGKTWKRMGLLEETGLKLFNKTSVDAVSMEGIAIVCIKHSSMLKYPKCLRSLSVLQGVTQVGNMNKRHVCLASQKWGLTVIGSVRYA